jgi:hypothetical protein
VVVGQFCYTVIVNIYYYHYHVSGKNLLLKHRFFLLILVFWIAMWNGFVGKYYRFVYAALEGRR